MKIGLKKIIQGLVFFGFGSTLLYLVYRSSEKGYQAQCQLDGIQLEDCNLIEKVMTDFGSTHWGWMMAVFAAFLLSNLSRAIRWRMLIEPLGKKPGLLTIYLSIMLSYFANLGFPRIGEFIRAGVIAKYSNLPVEKVMGTVFLDRLADLIIFLILCGVVLVLQWNLLAEMIMENTSVNEGGFPYQWILLPLVAFAGIFSLRYILKSSSQHPILLKIRKIILGFWAGIQTIAQIKKVGWFIFHSLFIWVMFFMMTFLAFQTFDKTAHLGAEAGLTAFVSGALGFVIPSPGGMGSYHFFIEKALELYGISRADGFSFANIMFFAVQIGCNVSLGILALFLLPRINRSHEKGLEATN